MKKEMLINILQEEECRIAIIENGVLEELYVERTSQESYVGNIYKGRIVNIEPSIQAAFVDFGIGRNGFLHVSDVDPAYYRHLTGFRPERGERGDNGDRSDRRFNGGRNERGGDRGRGRDRDRDRDRGGRGSRRSMSYTEEELAALEAVEPLADTDMEFAAPPSLEPVVIPETPRPEAPIVPPARTEIVATAKVIEPESAEDVPFGLGLEDTPATSVQYSPFVSRSEQNPTYVVAPPSEDESSFGAGIDEAAPGPESKPSAETVVVTVTESSAEPLAKPESPSEQPAKPKRPRPVKKSKDSAKSKARASARTKKSKTGKSAESAEEAATIDRPKRIKKPKTKKAETTPLSEADSESGRKKTSRRKKNPDQSDDQPRVMDSAERRTHRDDEEFGAIAGDPEPIEMGGTDFPPPIEESRNYPEPTYDDSNYEEVEEPDIEEDEDGRTRHRSRGRKRNGSGHRGREGRPKPLIQDIFKRGQEVLVQVIKEGMGTKGPTLSTYISIAGRYLVLMPGLNRIGVSRKIMDEGQRDRLKQILEDLRPPKGVGFIIRTAGIDRNRKELQTDLAYLLRLWQVVVRRIKKVRSPVEVYRESDMVTRTIRDTFSPDISSIVIDQPDAFAAAQEFMSGVMPRYADRLKCYSEPEPLFYRYRIEEEINRIQHKYVPLPLGGSIVIEQTEALVAIDVNSGNFRADGNNAEETAYQINLHAAKEIARQLRLRDLGGVIVNDFIDMKDERHRRGVENAMREAVKRDRARTKVLRISQFGLIEMTRQRIRPSLKRSIYQDCAACRGFGYVKTVESMMIDVMRLLQLAATRENIATINVRVNSEVASNLLNRKRREIAQLEQTNDVQILVTGEPNSSPEYMNFVCTDNNGHDVRFNLPEQPQRLPSAQRPLTTRSDRSERDRGPSYFGQ